jgi:hypothetical protein
MYERDHKNILLHQIYAVEGTTSFREVVPGIDTSSHGYNILSLDTSGNLFWIPLPEIPEIPEIPVFPEIPDFQVIKDGRISQTEIYYSDGRVGISRAPLLNYKFDIEVPRNTLMTAFHIGDGVSGFSMGNGTANGFIPEIIGMGFDEDDAGLYLLGKAGNNTPSSVPLIILDGRDAAHGALQNRPIFGITSGSYNDYKLLLDSDGRLGLGKSPERYKLEVEGDVQAHDFIINGLSIRALIQEVSLQRQEIDRLKDIINLQQK